MVVLVKSLVAAQVPQLTGHTQLDAECGPVIGDDGELFSASHEAGNPSASQELVVD